MKKKPVDIEEFRIMKEVPKGEFVRIVGPSGRVQKVTYINYGYDPALRLFELIDDNDTNHYRYLKGNHTVQVGFTY